MAEQLAKEPNMALATLGGGCFWCTEAIFKRLKGVTSVVSGYAGGDLENPSYSAVTTGRTNHAEAVQIHFDPITIPYERLLDVFWATHNPTTKNQQGADVGTQYRSVIFYHNNEQKRLAEQSKAKQHFDKPIVTEIVPFENFYKAEDYHQNYYDNAPANPYCTIVIDPKIDKLLKEFGKEVKEEYKRW